MRITNSQAEDLQQLLDANHWTPQQYYDMQKRYFIAHIRRIFRDTIVTPLTYDYAIDELQTMFKLHTLYDIER